jgi:hypothetical protein
MALRCSANGNGAVCTSSQDRDEAMRSPTHTVIAGHSRPKDGVLSHAYVPAIHVFAGCRVVKTWMPATSAGMTN